MIRETGRGRSLGHLLAGAFFLLAIAHGALAADAALALPRILAQDNLVRDGIVLKSPVRISADTLKYDEASETALAEGNVEINFGNRALRADKIQYNAKTGDVDLVGRVHYKDAGDEFSFDRITLNTDTEKGVLYNGTIRIGASDYLITSNRLEKTGERSFLIEKGSITTCPCDPEPDWKFEVRRSTVTIDGYAVGRDVTFRIRGVPVLYLPWGAFPVKLTRQSGFLLPDFERSPGKGFTVSLPLYWAVSRWSDATLTTTAMSRRGIRPELEYRFALNPSSMGTMAATSYRDKALKDERHRFYGENVFHHGEDWTANLRWDLASDDSYYEDLVEKEILRTSRHVPSRAFLGRNGEASFHSLGIVYAKDVQRTAGTDRTLNRFPEFTAVHARTPMGGSGAAIGGTLQADYFHRREGNEKIAQGRADIGISRPIGLYPSVFVTPYVSVDLFGADVSGRSATGESGSRVIPWGGVDWVAELRRDYPRKDNAALVHVVRPQAGFLLVPTVGHDNLVLTDHWSRVGSKRLALFSVEQRILLKPQGKGPSEWASIEIAWAQDFGERRSEGSPYVDPLSPYIRSLREQIELATGNVGAERTRKSDLYGWIRVTPAASWRLSGEALFVPGEWRIASAAVSGEWKRNDDNFSKAEYRMSNALAEDVRFAAGVRPVKLLGFRGDVNYSIREGTLTEGTASLTVYPRSDCWNIGIQVHKSTKPDETSYKLGFTLKGIGSFGK